MSSFAPGEVPTPPLEPDVPPPDFKTVAKAFAKGVEENNKAQGFWDWLAGWIVYVAGLAVFGLFKVASTLGQLIGKSIIEGENRLSDEYAELAALGVEDLFGVKPDIGKFIGRESRAARQGLSREIGDSTIRALFPKFDATATTDLEPSTDAAKEWLGFIMQFSMEGWLADVVGEVTSAGIFEKFGELDDVVSGNMGLGRLSRRALSPAVDTFIVTPLEQKLNKQVRPKLLSPAQAVSQFWQKRLTKEQLEEELARQGFSTSRIDALINEAERSYSIGDAIMLYLKGYWTHDDTVRWLELRSCSNATAVGLIEIERVKAVESEKEKFAAATVQAYVNRDIDQETFRSMLDTANIHPDVKQFMILTAGLRREFNVKKLSMSEAEQAVKRGFWTIRQFTDYLKDQGMSDDDVLTKQLLLQDEIRLDVDAQKKRDAAEKERAAEKAARKAEALRRQQELEAQRAHKELTLAQVETAFVRGRITSDQYADFLRGEKFVPADVQLLLDLATGNRADFIEAERRRAATDQKLSATSLTSQQLQQAVELGDLTLTDWRRILVQQGIPEEDIGILEHELMVTLQERQDAQKRRAQVQAGLAKKELNLDQFERAVRRGLKSMAEYKAFLLSAGYGPEDQGVLAGLLQASIDDEVAAQRKRAEVEAALKNKRISLSDMERAVRRKLRPIGDYRQLLQASGLVARDVDTLVDLLADTIAEDDAERQRKAEIEARLGTKRLALSDAARAVRLGLAPLSLYQGALDREGLPPEDQAVMMSLLASDVNDAAAAKAARVAAEEQTKNKPAPLAEVAKAVRQGFRSIGEYKSALQRAGFAPDAVDLQATLLQDEVDQLAAAKQRRAELDAKKAEPELSRAELERAVKAGVRQIPDYRQYLVDHGYGLIDTITLENLLLSELK